MVLHDLHQDFMVYRGVSFEEHEKRIPVNLI
jgi:hypothetical protein